MTAYTEIKFAPRHDATDIIGPYSAWPRKPRRRLRRPIALAGTVGAAAVFVHCVVPVIA